MNIGSLLEKVVEGLDSPSIPEHMSNAMKIIKTIIMATIAWVILYSFVLQPTANYLFSWHLPAENISSVIIEIIQTLFQ